MRGGLGPVVIDPQGSVRKVSLKEAVTMVIYPGCREGAVPLTKKERKRIYDQRRFQKLKEDPEYLKNNAQRQREWRARKAQERDQE